MKLYTITGNPFDGWYGSIASCNLIFNEYDIRRILMGANVKLDSGVYIDDYIDEKDKRYCRLIWKDENENRHEIFWKYEVYEKIKELAPYGSDIYSYNIVPMEFYKAS